MSRLVFITAVALGCADTVPTETVHFARPIATTVVCKDATGPQPLSACGTGKAGILYAYVLNGDTGSITRVELPDGPIVDEDAFIPGFTPTQVGTASVAIVASLDGSAVFTADAGERRITKVDTVGLTRQTQALPGVATDLAISADTLFVALPDARAVARIPLAEFGALTEIEAIPLPEGTPYDLALSPDGAELWVSHADTPWVSLVDIATGAETRRIGLANPCKNQLDDNDDGLIDSGDGGCRTNPDGTESDQVSPPVPPIILPAAVTPPACFDKVDNDGDGQTDYPAEGDCIDASGANEGVVRVPVLSRLAISPDGAWVYATNARERTVEVIETATATRVDVNAEGAPGAIALFRRLHRAGIVIPGAPSDISFAATEDGKALAAIVTSGNGNVFFIDVVDAEGEIRHRLRTTPATAESDELGVYSPAVSAFGRTVSGAPEEPGVDAVFVGGDVALSLGGDRRPEQPSFGEFTTPRDADGEIVSWYGITVVDDADVLLPNEVWSAAHQGTVLDRSAQPLLVAGAEARSFLTLDRPFCRAGVEVGDWLYLYPQATPACDGLDTGILAYEIESVFEDRLVVKAGTGKQAALFDAGGDAVGGAQASAFESAPDPTAACFQDIPLSYAVHAPPGQYLVRGSTSGALHPWIRGDNGQCVQDPAALPEHVSRTREWSLAPGKSLERCPPTDAMATDSFQGEYFENHAVRFRLLPGCERDLDTKELRTLETRFRATWSFISKSGRVLTLLRDENGALVRLGLPRGLFANAPDGRTYLVDPAQNLFLGIDPGTATMMFNTN